MTERGAAPAGAEPGPAHRVSLGATRYGKAETRVVRVDRSAARHRIRDLNVSIALAGDVAETYLTGDNASVLPTDSQKNAVYAFAQEHGIGEPEEFALRLARYFVETQPAINWARVSAEEYGWDRIELAGAPAPHSFARSGRETRLVSVTCTGARAWVVSGLSDLVLLNTTDSEFRGYPRDRYTTLPETGDRVLATAVTARWRHADAAGDWAESYREVRRHLIEAFAGTYSRSLQQTLYAMAERVLAARPELAEIRLTLPNRHHLLVDLAPFGLPNANETFVAADRPYGLIEGSISRDGAPEPGEAW
ncbi:MAG TPA: urate oxidase [Mycobacteriales bacterium]|nr:urate oxidase [Mycobacteriales bacterium]